MTCDISIVLKINDEYKGRHESVPKNDSNYIISFSSKIIMQQKLGSREMWDMVPTTPGKMITGFPAEERS